MNGPIRKLIIFSIAALCFWLIGFQIEQYAHRAPDSKHLANELETKIQQAEKQVDAIFSNSTFLLSAINNDLPKDSIEKYEALPFTLLIYTDTDSLCFWSNSHAFPYSSDVRFSNESVRKDYEPAGSHYLMIKQPYEIVVNQIKYRYTLIGLVPVYLRYPILNSYLSSHFPLMDNDFSNYVELSRDTNQLKTETIYTTQGEELVHLEAKSAYPYRSFIIWGFIAYILFGLSVIMLLYEWGAIIRKRIGFGYGLLFFVLGLLSFRIATVYAEFPRAAQQLDIFELHFSATNLLWFFSLGDFLIDVSLMGCISLFMIHQWKVQGKQKWAPWRQWLFTVLSYLFTVGGLLFLQMVLRDLVLHSDIYFEFEDFSKLDVYSFYALTGIVLLFMAFFISTMQLFRLTEPFKLPLSAHAMIFGASLLAVLGLGFAFQLDWYIHLYNSMFITVLVLLLLSFSKERQLTFIWISAWLFYFGVVATAIMEQANMDKNLAIHKDLLQSVTYEQDYRVEEAFLEMEKDIIEDQFINIYFSSPYIPPGQVIERLSSLYLDKKFFGRYKYDIKLYSGSGMPKSGRGLSLGEIDAMLASMTTTASKYLYFDSDINGRYSYIAKLPIYGEKGILGSILIELTPKPSANVTSIYVELLSLSKTRSEKYYDELNYTLYKNNQRVFASSGSSFPAILSYEIKLPEPGEFLKTRAFDESLSIMYMNEKGYIAIVEKEEESLLKPLSIFSYLFCSGIIAVFVLFLIVFIGEKLVGVTLIPIVFKSSLRERIQQGIVVMSLLSFAAIGVISFIYFRAEYADYHKSRLERKIESTAKTATWQIMNSSDSVVRIPDARDLSSIHKIDVNVYDLNGRLLSTSEDAVFERRLISRQMDPVAFYKMKVERLSSFSHTEKINDFEYLSGYVPLKNRQGEIIAFLNLPYDLAGSNNLRSQDVAEFLGALLNVYVIFLLLAGVVAFILANSVTRPLSVIGEKLRQIKVGGKNDKIKWKSKDEIGSFVERFNEMIVALEESSQQLARTQRETAWREMAKQVAHEIKNPLTPMKLQIQMLERAAQKDPEKASKMVKRITKTLIEQIDNLAHIASEFSNFAKMPIAKNEIFVLNPLVESVYNLFHEEENVQLRLEMTEKQLAVYVDKNQILRVLNNLVKNAIQSIPEDRPGIIEIELMSTKNYAIVRVRDNGCGIPDEKMYDIFVPYFTTKSSGTGIGLAMSKNIVEAVKGRIYFDSEVGKGTDFYIEIPLHKAAKINDDATAE